MNRKIATYAECIDRLCALVESDYELSDDEYKTLDVLFNIAETILIRRYPKIEELETRIK